MIKDEALWLSVNKGFCDAIPQLSTFGEQLYIAEVSPIRIRIMLSHRKQLLPILANGHHNFFSHSSVKYLEDFKSKRKLVFKQ